MKKFLSFLLAAMLVLGMVATANAVNTDIGDEFTIAAPENNHTYEIFQIFTANLSRNEQNEIVLSEVKWGTAGTGTVGTDVPDEVLDALKAKNSASDREIMNTITNYVKLDGKGITISSGQSQKVPAGYYLIRDNGVTDPAEGEIVTKSIHIVQICDNITIQPKAEKPSFEKKIKDTNDTTATNSGWQDSADYDIGDDVPFLLKGTVAADYDDYTAYKFVFHDQLEAGKLSFNKDSVVVKVGEQAITTGYEVKEDAAGGFTVEFDDLKQVSDVKANSVITVEFTAKLLPTANIGSMGNINTAYLEFSNNPNVADGSETSETPKDTVIAFTYKLQINKVNANGEKIAGATFKLEKKVQETPAADGVEASYQWKELLLVTSEEGKVFSFNGLDDGIYRLTEDEAPIGYNKADPMIFEVSATHTTQNDSLDNTDTTRKSMLTALTGAKDTGSVGEISITHDKESGLLSTNIVNLSGATLPETGGIGTTIFYLLGSIMFIGAAMTLVVRRRADAEEV